MTRKPRIECYHPNRGRVKKSTAEENRIAGRLGGRRLPRSGGMPWSTHDPTTAGGDITTPTLHIEHKRVEPQTKGIRITRDWLSKVTAGAKRQIRIPAMVITFEKPSGHAQDWALVPLEIVERLMSVLEE